MPNPRLLALCKNAASESSPMRFGRLRRLSHSPESAAAMMRDTIIGRGPAFPASFSAPTVMTLLPWCAVSTAQSIHLRIVRESLGYGDTGCQGKVLSLWGTRSGKRRYAAQKEQSQTAADRSLYSSSIASGPPPIVLVGCPWSQIRSGNQWLPAPRGYGELRRLL